MKKCSKNALLRSLTFSLHFSFYHFDCECFATLMLLPFHSLCVCCVLTNRRVYRWMQMFCTLRQPSETFFFFQSIFCHRTLVGAFNFKSSTVRTIFTDFFFIYLFFFVKIQEHSSSIIIINHFPKTKYETQICRKFWNFVVRIKQILVFCIDFSFRLSIHCWRIQTFMHNTIANFTIKHARTRVNMFQSSFHFFVVANFQF